MKKKTALQDLRHVLMEAKEKADTEIVRDTVSLIIHQIDIIYLPTERQQIEEAYDQGGVDDNNMMRDKRQEFESSEQYFTNTYDIP